LQSLEEDDDVLTAMARELVNKQQVGEEASVIWKRLQAEQPVFGWRDATMDTNPDSATAILDPAWSEREVPLPELLEAVQLALGF
jgi:hypothetical protein